VSSEAAILPSQLPNALDYITASSKYKNMLESFKKLIPNYDARTVDADGYLESTGFFCKFLLICL
jgi:hypothetical protein